MTQPETSGVMTHGKTIGRTPILSSENVNIQGGAAILISKQLWMIMQKMTDGTLIWIMEAFGQVCRKLSHRCMLTNGLMIGRRICIFGTYGRSLTTFSLLSWSYIFSIGHGL